MSALLSRALPRRTLLKALMAVPAFSLFRSGPPVPASMPEPINDDAIVEVGGWILKRSDVA